MCLAAHQRVARKTAYERLREPFGGYWTQSGEYMVANSEGANKTRTMKRIPETERWDKSGIEGTPRTSFGSSRRAAALGVRERPTIEIDKSISVPAPPRVEDHAMPSMA